MTKIVYSNHNHEILVDDDLYTILNQYTWYITHGYARNNKLGGMHSFITGYAMTDHIDRDRLNNQRYNLRRTTKSTNGMNRGITKNNTSGFKGVHWEKSRGLWRSEIQINNQNTLIGRYNNAIEAALVYDCYARRLHKEFACLNFPDVYQYSTILTHSINQSGNKTGYRGIVFSDNTFQVRCRRKGHEKYLGRYKTAEEAAFVYDQYLASIDKSHQGNGLYNA